MHSFNFIALSAFIKTHLSLRERENKEKRALYWWRVKGERGSKGKETVRQTGMTRLRCQMKEIVVLRLRFMSAVHYWKGLPKDSFPAQWRVGLKSCETTVASRSKIVWGAQLKWLMVNLGYSGPMGKPILVSILIPSSSFPILLSSPPTCVSIYNCLGRGSSDSLECPFVSLKNGARTVSTQIYSLEYF